MCGQKGPFLHLPFPPLQRWHYNTGRHVESIRSTCMVVAWEVCVSYTHLHANSYKSLNTQFHLHHFAHQSECSRLSVRWSQWKQLSSIGEGIPSAPVPCLKTMLGSLDWRRCVDTPILPCIKIGWEQAVSQHTFPPKIQAFKMNRIGFLKALPS